MPLFEQFVTMLNTDNLAEEFNNTSSFESRIKVMLYSIDQSLIPNLNYEKKNSEKSIHFIEEANKLYFKEKGRINTLIEAWELYSKSIATSDKSSTTIALAYANRSAILYNLNKFTECIQDIDAALKLNYPNHLKANLLRRKAKCFKILGKTEVDEICEEAIRWLENVSLSDDKKKRLEVKINNTSNDQLTLERINYESQSLDLPKIIPHKNIPSASDAIDIKYNKVKGRHLVANRDIGVGEILIIEKSYVSLLNAENIYTHCSHCLIRAWHNIPCDHCSFTMYCSEKCKNKAWQQYHDIECPVKQFFFSKKMINLVPMSIKLIILAVKEKGGIKELQRYLKQIKDGKCNVNQKIYCI
jgi:tetratricopeptide (TPR) repeat protein